MPYFRRRHTYRRRRKNPYARRTRNGIRKGKYSRGRARLTDSTQYAFKRTVSLGAITSSASPPTFGSKHFRLDDLPSYTEFTSLFDAYKISGVSMKFFPRVTDNSVAAASFGTFLYTSDFNDTNIPVTVDELMSRQSTKYRQVAGKPFKIFIRPKYAVNTGSTSLFGQSSVDWVDTASFSTPWYGFKWAWTNTTHVTTIDCYITYYLKFKQVK